MPQTPHTGSARSPRGLGASPYIAVKSLFDTTFYHSKPFAMAAPVLVNNSHTPRHSSNIPHNTPSTKPSTSGVQLQNTPNARLNLDERVNRILDKAKSPSGEGEVRVMVEALEKVSGMHLLPTDRCTQPTDDRCWTPDAPWTCARGGDVFGDS